MIKGALNDRLGELIGPAAIGLPNTRPVGSRMSHDKPRAGSRGPPTPHDPMLWRVAAMKFAADVMFWWLDQGGGREAPPDRPELPWTTPNRIALELATMRVRDFSRAGDGQP